MKLTSQYVSNPKGRRTFVEVLGFNSYKAIKPTKARCRLNVDYQFLSLKKIYNTFTVNGVAFNMIGCPRYTSSKSKFLLGEAEVTQELFQAVMKYNPSEFQGHYYPNSKQRPVEKVTWFEALIFCNKLSIKLNKNPYYIIPDLDGKDEIEAFCSPNNKEWIRIKNAMKVDRKANGFRLPLWLEWEYAALAQTKNECAGTSNKNEVDSVAWFKDNSNGQTHPIKCKRPNEWGFYDMSGNVWEWTADSYSESNVIYRIVCGFSWVDSEEELQQSIENVSYFAPLTRNENIGFRILLPLDN